MRNFISVWKQDPWIQECWNILRGEQYSAIDSFVPMKK